MAKKVCSAGVVGPFSYLIVDNEEEVVASIHGDGEKISATHIEMDVAEQWTERNLQRMMERVYETD